MRSTNRISPANAQATAPPLPHELQHVSAAFLAAVGEALALARRGELGRELADRLHHASELHDLLDAALSMKDGTGDAYARELGATLGEQLVAVRSLLHARNSSAP